MDCNKPSYYAIIPANVRYDKDLCANAKLLYGEITSLCNEKGYCWATNQYFANLYEVSDRTIQNLLKQLVEKNYIQIKILDNFRRLIYINFTMYEKNFTPGTKKISSPHEKNFTLNNKYNIKNEYMNEILLDDVLNCDWLEREY